MKFLRFCLPLVLAVCACGCSRDSSRMLETEGWDESVHRALCSVIAETSAAGEGAYAVFDCDFTSIVHDVEHTLATYLVENLAFAEAPDHGFLDGVEDRSVMLEEWGMPAEQAGAVLAEEYAQLKAFQTEGLSLEEIHALPLYLDFRARFVSFNAALVEVVDYGTDCLWSPSLLTGMTWEEAAAVVNASLRHALSIPPVMETWVSPDGAFSGVAEKGLVVPANTRNLFRALQRNGIDVYIVSASLEMIVEALACDPEMGFGLDPDRVFGVRLVDGETLIPRYQEGYVQPYLEGKVQCVETLIAPAYGGAAPVLVAGDSNGDYAMLTAWPSMKCGLIMDCGRKGKIAELVAQAKAERNRGRYVVQSTLYSAE